jgi:polysaccharide biosynthesis/export protein ExoF
MKTRVSICLVVAIAASLGVRSASAEYLLGPADAVRVKVGDWPDLSGEYAVNAEGRIALPMIGEIEAKGLNTGALASAIAARLKSETSRSGALVAAVEVIRYRPVYIMGDVQRPGELVFRPGLTVLQALSMAGGYYRATDQMPLRTDREIATAQGDIEASSRLLKARLARAARLEAALAGQSDVSFPDDILANKTDPATAALMADELRVLSNDQAESAESLKALERIKALYEKEIASLNAQSDALQREQDSIQKQLKAVKGLADKGLASSTNLLLLERTLAQNQNQQLGLATAAVRARQNIALAEDRVRQGEAERRRIQVNEIQTSKAELADAEGRIGTGQALVLEAISTARAQGQTPQDDTMRRREVIVVRKDQDGTLRDIKADDGMLLEADDVIKIMPLPLRTGPAVTGTLPQELK